MTRTTPAGAAALHAFLVLAVMGGLAVWLWTALAYIVSGDC